MLLLDMGKASKVTKGFLDGLFTEAGTPPFNHFNCTKNLDCNPLLCPPRTCEHPKTPDDPLPQDLDKVF